MSNNPFWDQQQELFKTWNENMSKIPGMQAYENLYKNMMPNANEYWSQFSQAMSNPADAWTNYTNQMNNLWSTYANQMSGYTDFMKKMTETLTNPFSAFQNANPFQLPGMETFSKMFDMWKDLGDPAKFAENFEKNYMEVTGNLIKSLLPAGAAEFFQQPKELMDTCVNMYKEIFSPWMQIDNTILQRIASGDIEAYLDFFDAFEAQYEQTFEKIFNTMPLGLYRETIEDELQLMNAYYKMMISAGKLMAQLYICMQKSMKVVIESYQKMLEEGKEVTTFLEFYNLWYKVNEDALEALFDTDAFSKAFGDFSDKTGKYMVAQNKILERSLSNLPIPTNKDMKALYKTVYDLRKAVRDLQKEVAALKAVPEAK